MDQAFLLRARRLLEQRPLARLMYPELLMAVARQRTSSPTVHFAEAAERAATATGALQALTNALLNDTVSQVETAQNRLACFNRAVAKRRVKER